MEGDGPDISGPLKAAAFEPGVSTGEEGMGFGPSTLQQIVDARDWEIRVTDEHDGHARFEITGVEFAAE